jgi:hypothetical protein
VLLTWWAHPFTGLELSAIVGAHASVEGILGRHRGMRGLAVGVAVTSLVFLAYYLVLLPARSPEAEDIATLWRRMPGSLELAQAPVMWGTFLVAPLLMLHPRARPRGWLRRRRWRLVVAWLVVVTALLLHDRIVTPGFVPLHFAHGYLFVPLAILTVSALVRLGRRLAPRTRCLAAAAFLAVASVDNALFVAQVARSYRPVVAPDLAAMVGELARQPPALVLLTPLDHATANYLLVATPHRAYLAGEFLTPFFREKAAAVDRMLGSASPAAEARRLGIRWVVAGRGASARFAGDVDAGRARRVLREGRFTLLEIPG